MSRASVAGYRGDEEAVSLPPASPAVRGPSEFIAPLHPGIPAAADALAEPESGLVIGFRVASAAGVWRIYDVEGSAVGIEEAPLEEPLFSPTDLLLIAAAPGALLFRWLGLRLGLAGLARAGGVLVVGSFGARSASISERCLKAILATYRRLAIPNLKFTQATLRHMNEPHRFVPVAILRLTVLYGQRSARPKGTMGAFRYVMQIARNGKPAQLEVVIRESDGAVLHFLADTKHYMKK